MEARVGMVIEGGKQRPVNADVAAAAKLLPQQNNQLGTVNQLLAGGVAGAFSKTCTAPLARLTILFQVSFILCCFFLHFYFEGRKIHSFPYFLSVNLFGLSFEHCDMK